VVEKRQITLQTVKLIPTFIQNSPENAATTVRNEVKRVQANFLNSLDKDGLLGQVSEESDVKLEIIMEMEYQYATVALISNSQTLLALADKSEVTYIELDKLNRSFPCQTDRE